MKDNRAQYEDLLFDRVLHGLEDEDEQRFRELDANFADDPALARERTSMEEAVAALHLALLDQVEPLPDTLRRDLEAQADRLGADRPPTDLP